MARTAHNAVSCPTCGRLSPRKSSLSKRVFCSLRCKRYRRRPPGKVERTKPKGNFNFRPRGLL